MASVNVFKEVVTISCMYLKDIPHQLHFGPFLYWELENTIWFTFEVRYFITFISKLCKPVYTLMITSMLNACAHSMWMDKPTLRSWSRCLSILQPFAEHKAWIDFLPFLVKIVENTCNFVNSCSIYINIDASKSPCESKGDCILRIWW